MTPEDLVAQLAPIRVPLHFAEFGLRDALALISLGILAGLCLSLPLRALTRAARGPEKPTSLPATATPQERLTELALDLRRSGAPVPPELHRALYDPSARFDPTACDDAHTSPQATRP
ncbi:hypothetical protein [Litorisediminicola beolgyonensis]|uniref:Uncharacterized protein n=1 Tax=Litorisediminicola beolgyonensis TaxID=1173614 RepID=A0ABW3ZI76_9RHOB